MTSLLCLQGIGICNIFLAFPSEVENELFRHVTDAMLYTIVIVMLYTILRKRKFGRFLEVGWLLMGEVW